jgi:hypothetical protein
MIQTKEEALRFLVEETDLWIESVCGVSDYGRVVAVKNGIVSIDKPNLGVKYNEPINYLTYDIIRNLSKRNGSWHKCGLDEYDGELFLEDLANWIKERQTKKGIIARIKRYFTQNYK